MLDETFRQSALFNTCVFAVQFGSVLILAEFYVYWNGHVQLSKILHITGG